MHAIFDDIDDLRQIQAADGHKVLLFIFSLTILMANGKLLH
jgi:hypothetical protein